MRLYDYGPSQNCFKVRLLVAHLGVALEIVPVSIFKGEAASPEFLAKNPMGTVPCSRPTRENTLRSRMQSLRSLRKGHATCRPTAFPARKSCVG
jgi:glutathione S-transferase